jgi:hypothetical protein
VLNWLLRFLVCALVIVIVVYVCHMLLGMISLPDPARIIIMLIIAVAVLIAVVQYLGWPPSTGGP